MELLEVYYAIGILVAQRDQAAQLCHFEVYFEDGECGLELGLVERTITVCVKDLKHFGDVVALGLNCFS